MWGNRVCKVCEAKDREVEHLLAILERTQGQLEKAQARLAEIQAPGVTGRLEPRPVRPLVKPPSAPVAAFPGYAPERQPMIEVEP